MQRDEKVIQRGRDEVCPQLLRQARRKRRVVVLDDGLGFYLLLGLVRIYAPEAQTRVIPDKTRDHLPVMAGMTPEGKVYTLARQESLSELHSIKFLTCLRRVAGTRVLVLWDGSLIHRRASAKEFVAATASCKVRLEALPGYAPDVNPWDEEGGITSIKDVEIRQLECRDLEELHQEFYLAVGGLGQKSHLVLSFFAQARLKIEKT